MHVVRRQHPRSMLLLRPSPVGIAGLSFRGACPRGWVLRGPRPVDVGWHLAAHISRVAPAATGLQPAAHSRQAVTCEPQDDVGTCRYLTVQEHLPLQVPSPVVRGSKLLRLTTGFKGLADYARSAPAAAGPQPAAHGRPALQWLCEHAPPPLRTSPEPPRPPRRR